MKALFLSVLSTVFSLIVAVKYSIEDQIVKEKLCDSTVNSYAGYFSTEAEPEHLKEKNYFFWLFESKSNPSTDPLLIWLTGGPGCSSTIALFTENGPCTVNSDGKSTTPNPYSWNNNANVIFIDQPASVGYSYGIIDDHNEAMISEDMYHFLQEFFRRHPRFQTNPFFIFGESYAGHYLPAIGKRIFDGNTAKEGLPINLQGVGIGNGQTKSSVQYRDYPTMAMNNSYDIKTVSEEIYSTMLEKLPKCIELTSACQTDLSQCNDAYWYCNINLIEPFDNTGRDPHDIRKMCEGKRIYILFSLCVLFLIHFLFLSLYFSYLTIVYLF
jgi:cathepsin A (carboxypeptidase C)